MGNIKGLTVKIGGDTTGLQKALKDVDSTLGKNQKKLKELNTALKFDPKNTELLAQKQELLTESIKKSKEKVELLKKAQAQAKEDMENGVEVAKDKYNELSIKISEAEAKTKGLNTQLENTNKAIKDSKFAGFEKVGGQIQDVGNKISGVGTKVTAVSGAIVAAGAACMAAFKEVDEGADNVIKATGATGEAAAELNAVYENVAKTVVGDFGEIGNVVGELNTRFGLVGSDLEDLSVQFVQFSEITGQDAKSAVSGVAKAMQIFGVDASETQNVLGLLAKTAQDTGIDVSTLESLLQSSEATFSELGMSIEESIQLMGVFESAGIESTTMLAALKKAATSYSKEGKSMSEGLNDLITRLGDSSTQAQATTEAYEVFGARAGLQFINLAKQGKISLSGLETDLSKYGSVVTTTYEETLDGTDSMALAWQKVKIAASQLGEVLDKKLGKLVEKLGDKIKGLSEWFNNLSEEQAETIVKVAALVAAIGPLIIVIGKLTTAIGVLVANPVAGLLVACVAVGAAIGTAIGETHNMITAQYGLTDSMKETSSAIMEQVNGWEELDEARENSTASIVEQAENSHILWQELQNITDENGKIKEGYEARAQIIAGELADALGIEIDVVDGVIQKYGELKDSVEAVIQRQKTQALIDAGKDSYATALTSKTALYDKILARTKEIAEAEKTYIEAQKYYEENKGTDLYSLDRLNAAKDAYNQLVDEQEGAITTYGEYCETIRSYEQLVGESATGTSETVKTATDDWIATVNGSKTRFLVAGLDAFEGVELGIYQNRDNVTTAGISVVENAVGGVGSAVGKFKTEGKNASDNYAEGTESEAGNWSFRSKILQVVSKAKSAISDNNNFEGLGEDAGTGYAKGARNSTVESLLGSSAKWIVDKLKEKIKASQQSGSPAKQMMPLGEYAGWGYAEGIKDSEPMVQESAQSLVKAAKMGLEKGYSVEASRIMGEAQGLSANLQYAFGNLNFTPQINNQNDIYLDSMPIARQVNKQLGGLV